MMFIAAPIKKLLLACTLLLACSFCFAQDIPKTIPPFNMVLSDGVTYHNADKVEKNKPLMIVYFDPECQHCQEFTKKLVKNISKFNTVQIVMICSVPGLPPLKKFVDMFGLTKYPSIKAGTEGMYQTTLKFYDVDTTPFVALYDKDQKLITFHRTVPEIGTLVKEFGGK